MERTLEIRTAESVAVSYELAGLGSRFLAVTIDLAIQVAGLAAVAALTLAALWIAQAVLRAPHGWLLPKRITSGIEAIAILVVFLIFVGYFVAFEAWWRGSTPGKRALRIRVLRDGAYPVDFMSALIRNAVRSIEFLVGFYTLSAVSVLASPSNKRLGDYAAGTIVVRDRPLEGARPGAA